MKWQNLELVDAIYCHYCKIPKEEQVLFVLSDWEKYNNDYELECGDKLTTLAKTMFVPISSSRWRMLCY